MKKIILASASPRRQALLRQAGIPFGLRVNDVSEDVDGGMTPFDVVKTLSERKARAALAGARAEEIIIAADTIVAVNGQILGKPVDGADAADMLRKLRGRTHSVYTGVTFINADPADFEVKTIVDTASVTMRDLSDEEISSYINTGEPADKAGAYAIQGKGAFLIEGVDGDFYTVMGLPLVKVYTALREWGVALSDLYAIHV